MIIIFKFIFGVYLLLFLRTDVLKLEFNVSKNRLYAWNYSDKNRFNYVDSIIKKFNSGWMILDYRRNGYWEKGYSTSGNFTIGGKNVVVIQNKAGFQIYGWGEVSLSI